jgi:hypothetical protein
MSGMYAMQRANGDWFAVKDDGRLRVPVFRNISEAMLALARNSGMLLFKPVMLDERALDDLAPTDDIAACFWLVDNPSIHLSRGRPLEHAQLALLIQASTAQLPG